MGILQLSRAQARRIAVRAEMLDLPRPGDLVEVVQQLSLLQIDPAAPIAPSAELVLWSRLGAAYRSADLQQALETRTLVELNGMIRPVEDLPAHLAGHQDWPPHERSREWLRVNDPFRQDILNQLQDRGPLLSKEIPDTSIVSWPSSGWTNDRNVTQMLEFLVMKAEVAVSGRRGRQRVFDLAERVYPELPAMTVEEAVRHRDERRLASLGIAKAKGTTMPSEPVDVRARAQDIFGYEYVLEVYKPASKRRWGYYALPILFGDRLVGKLDAKAERREGIFEVHAVHQDVAFTEEMAVAVEAEIDALADWLGLARLR